MAGSSNITSRSEGEVKAAFRRAMKQIFLTIGKAKPSVIRDHEDLSEEYTCHLEDILKHPALVSFAALADLSHTVTDGL